MKASTTKMVMKCVGATLAICSAVTMLEGKSMNAGCAKKSIKKTANRIINVVDTLSAMM